MDPTVLCKSRPSRSFKVCYAGKLATSILVTEKLNLFIASSNGGIGLFKIKVRYSTYLIATKNHHNGITK